MICDEPGLSFLRNDTYLMTNLSEIPLNED
jgi:hypothetical protein